MDYHAEVGHPQPEGARYAVDKFKVADLRRNGWPTSLEYAGVWTEAQKWLEQEPDIAGKALFERIRTNHPGEFAPGQLRTLQRRIREWRQMMAKQLLGVPESGEGLGSAINPSLAEPGPGAPHAPQGGEKRL